MSAMPVLLLDDDDELREWMADELQDAGFQPFEAASVAEAKDLVLHGPVRSEALILDVDLPDGDGRDFCARLRAAGLHMPIIMLAGSNKEDEVVRALEAGAHDYVAKPIRMAVLIARLRAHLRLHKNSTDAVFTLGPWQFHPARKLLRSTVGMQVQLTAKEVEILRHLQRLGRTVSKQVLLSDLWGHSPARSSYKLETHIYRLRQKIEADPANPRLLLTGEGGYRLASAEMAA
jgi:DNA-binding response OmpR family regulator